MKARKEAFDSAFDADEEFTMELLSFDSDDEEVTLFLDEAHDALNRLSQKTNKRGALMKQPRRAEKSWH